MHGRDEKCLIRKPEGEKTLERLEHGREDSI